MRSRGKRVIVILILMLVCFYFSSHMLMILWNIGQKADRESTRPLVKNVLATWDEVFNLDCSLENIEKLAGHKRSEEIFDDDYELLYFLMRMECGIPTVLSRWGDGEALITEERDVPLANEGWKFKGGRRTHLSRKLRESLQVKHENVFFGFSCAERKTWTIPLLKRMNKPTTSQITYATVFINYNYDQFSLWLKNRVLTGKLPVVLLVNDMTPKNRLGFAKEVIYATVDGVNDFEVEEIREKLLHNARSAAKRYENTLFLIAYGPVACVLVVEMWKANPNNVYIDIGSSIDPFFSGNMTRAYQDPSHKWAFHACKVEGKTHLLLKELES